jgi:hypothetical protein
MFESLRRKARAPVVVASILGLVACGQGGGEQASTSAAPSASASQELPDCNGLPRYQKSGADPDDTHAFLKVEEGTGCKTPMYDSETMQGIGEYIEPDTEFWACVPESDKPTRFEVTIVELQTLGATGTVNLGEAATAQLLAANDIPTCAA